MRTTTQTRPGQENGCGKRTLKCLDSHFSFPSSHAGLGRPLSSATITSVVEPPPPDSPTEPAVYFDDIVPEIVVRTDPMEIVDEETPGASPPAQESVRYVVGRS